MDWTTLISVVVGGLIATVPILINNRFQAREREKEREETRRESKTQFTQELMREDAKIIEFSLDDLINYLDNIEALNLSLLLERLTDEEIREKMQKELFSSLDDKYSTMRSSVYNAEKVASTFGKDFYFTYQEFLQLWTEYTGIFINFDRNKWSKKYQKELLQKVIFAAGDVHAKLREKLITIRDTKA